MNIRDEQELQQYFDRRMTSAEEQNFLIDVAARDEMRIAFRPQLELLKALRADKDAGVVAGVMLRNRTLAALGISASLLGDSSEKNQVAQTAAMPQEGLLKSLFRRPVVMLASGLIAGAAAMYSILPTNDHSAAATNSSKPIVTAPIIITEPAHDADAQTAPHQTSSATSISGHSSTSVLPTVHSSDAAKKTGDEQIPIVHKTNPSSVQVVTNTNK